MAIPAAVHDLERDLQGVFGSRLRSLVAYALRATAHASDDADAAHASHVPTRTMALVESMTEQDLRACAARVKAWHAAGLATPLLIAAGEFDRSLDVFPLEFGAIIADHVVVAGAAPFERSQVKPADIRRACEVQARSHLLHLREGFLEAGGNSHALAVLVVQSAAPLAALLASLARLEGRADPDPEAAARHAERALGLTRGLADVARLVTVHEIPAAEAEQIFPAYLAAVEKLVAYVDGWSAR